MDFRHEFIEFAVARQVLCFGNFKTKAGRWSPYFFNAGLFNDGESMTKLSGFYAQAILESGLEFDILFGPAYKGIPLVTGVAMALAARGKNLPFAYNRKETKDHGEGGKLVGAPLTGRVLIVDDVISAGTSVRESVDMISAVGAKPAGVIIALDRMERGYESELSAVQEIEQQYALPVIAVASLKHLMAFLQTHSGFSAYQESIAAYRSQYGVALV
jgi:orotate phosphoribosyltransferase